MAENNLLPKAQSQLVDKAGRPTRAFYDFFRALVNGFQRQINAIDSVVKNLATVIAALGGNPDGSDIPNISEEIDSKANKSTELRGIQSVRGGGDLGADRFFMLAGDVEAPRARSFYGVLDDGNKTWQTFSANFAGTDNGDGTHSLDLTDLPNSGAGTLQATTRDSKGRITGTRDATITGTAGRVTVAHGDASDGLPTIDLATVADVGGGTLQRTAFDAYGRKTGTSAATTSNLTEGDNLYFTDMRADARVAAGIAAHIAAPDPHPIYIDASDTIDGGNF